MDDLGARRRLAETVALTVPGVLEVRFSTPSSGPIRHMGSNQSAGRLMHQGR
jgi:hypothetical protein